ncbi:hypothetical protein BH09GEM1_BH09GEM1_16670 [soil metagenome]
MKERTLAACVAMIGLAGGMLGCMGDSPTLSPTQPQRARLGAPRPQGLARGLSGTICETRIASVDAGVFGPQGGTLIFGTSRLIIPAGALRDTVTISATTPNGDAGRVEFRPQGLQFAKAAGLLLDTSGCAVGSAQAPTVVYLSESGEVLETIPAVYDPHWHTIAAPIEHFSGYAIAF